MDNIQKLLFDRLKQLGITVETYQHEALFTVKEALVATHSLPGADVKNLFLKDDKKNLWLLVALAETKIELKKLSRFLPAIGLRFADATLLQQYLGITPGSVTPLGVMYDTAHLVTVLLDKKLFDHRLLKVHPLTNTATTVISPLDLQKFITASKNKIQIIDFDTLIS